MLHSQIEYTRGVFKKNSKDTSSFSFGSLCNGRYKNHNQNWFANGLAAPPMLDPQGSSRSEPPVAPAAADSVALLQTFGRIVVGKKHNLEPKQMEDLGSQIWLPKSSIRSERISSFLKSEE